MTDYLAELNRVMDHLAAQPDVVLTALTGGKGDEFLILTEERKRYTQSDDWASSFDVRLDPPELKGTLIERRTTLAGNPVASLFGEPGWASTEPMSDETARMLALGLFKIHDPRGLLAALHEYSGSQEPQFADNSQIGAYGDISSDFFRLVGLSEPLFISDGSRLEDWCDASGLALEQANTRIREVYGVDVSDLNGGRLIDVFDRIRQGEYYRAWRAAQDL
jgi:hypothetical protein